MTKSTLAPLTGTQVHAPTVTKSSCQRNKTLPKSRQLVQNAR